MREERGKRWLSLSGPAQWEGARHGLGHWMQKPYEEGHDWSLSSSFPDWKREDLPERQLYSVAQFRCTPSFLGPVS